MAEKYAVFFERVNDSGRHDGIKLLCETAPDREMADFKNPPWPTTFSNLNVERYESLVGAINACDEFLASSHINGGGVDVAGVVPVDSGDHEYMELGQIVKIGKPVYAARARTRIEKVRDYDVSHWFSHQLEITKEWNRMNPPPEEWEKVVKKT